MRLDAAAARAGIEREVAGPLSLSLDEAAWGIHAVANANMERAMRIVSIERGRDPRRYGLVAFGGAGPLHASRLARALGVPKVIVPVGAGVGSAIGLLTADAKIDVSATRILRMEPGNAAAMAAIFADLGRRAGADLEKLRQPGAVRWRRGAYMRYVGQGFEIRVELPAGPIGEDFAGAAIAAFEAAYKRTYGYADSGAPVEAIDWFLIATVPGLADRGATHRQLVGQDAARPVARATGRRAYFPEAGGWVAAAVVDRYAMRAGEAVAGPALIEEREALTVVLPGDTARRSSNGHLVIDIAGGPA
jgi:N-methylhydantoinase A